MKLNRPCMLSPEAIQEFKTMYYDTMGVMLDDGEAEKQGLCLIGFIASILELPGPTEDSL